MKTNKLFSLSITLLFFILNMNVVAQENLLKKEVDPSQVSESLKNTEKQLDERILEVNKSLSRYSRFLKTKGIIKYSPQNTVVTVNTEKNYVQIESYSFIQESKVSTELVGLKNKTMRLFFSGDNLVKIETEIFEDNNSTNTKKQILITDVSPTSVDTTDIELSSSTNNLKAYTTTFGDIQNTNSRPVRIQYKREYYTDNLVYFEKLFRFTEEFQQVGATNIERENLAILKQSLKY